MAVNTLTATQLRNAGILNGFIIPANSSIDPDAQAFITAASITDPTQQSAINQLVVDLKGYNIWTKFKALYPIVGGTAASHKWNLKDPRDLDAAFRLQFTNAWNHSSTGMTPNGANTYANTFLNPSTNLLIDNSHISIYSRTNNQELRAAIGTQFTGTQRFIIWPRTTSGTYLINNSDAPTGITNSDSRGLFINNRVSNTETRGMIRGVQYNRTIASSATYFNANITIGTVSTYYDNREYAFSSIGDGLTDVDMSNLTTAVQTFQTTLNRQV